MKEIIRVNPKIKPFVHVLKPNTYYLVKGRIQQNGNKLYNDNDSGWHVLEPGYRVFELDQKLKVPPPEKRGLSFTPQYHDR